MEPIPAATLATVNEKSRRLRVLVRAPEILIMPGAYDVLSALLFEQMGFKAIQGTSGGIGGLGLGRSADPKVVALRQAVLEKCMAFKGPPPTQGDTVPHCPYPVGIGT